MADPAPGSSGEELCAAQAPAALHFADPESARIRSVARAGAEAITYADKPTVSHRFNMIINAKNANGAYAGDRLFACFLSEDEHRVLKMEASGR